MFFSKVVTHVVTTRMIPADSPSSNTSSSRSESQPAGNTDDQPRTINPSLLDKHSVLQAQNFALKGQSGASGRREGAAAMDVLSRGRQMGMKIWALEKLQRIMVSMLEYDASGGLIARATITTASTTRIRDEELSQVLRNEKLNGPSDRDLATSTKDLTLFKGPFIYIHDMDAKTRPIMVREYPKVARRQDGTWPQFRSAPPGKCPFIDDPAPKKEAEKEKERERAVAAQQTREAQQVQEAQQAQQAQQLQQAPRTRSVVLCQEAHHNPPRRSPRKALKEVYNVPAPGPGFKDIVSKSHAFEAPRALPQMSFGAKQDAASTTFIKPQYMHLAREPAASGIQQSNITSAIRSQVISSTAAAPGVKAGLSKEVNELKRKVLERTNTGSLSVGSIPSSHRMNDLAGVLKNARAPAPPRAAKSKAQEKLGGITESLRCRRMSLQPKVQPTRLSRRRGLRGKIRSPVIARIVETSMRTLMM
jgi:regulatory subunit for Cdc7p protein kinase